MVSLNAFRTLFYDVQPVLLNLWFPDKMILPFCQDVKPMEPTVYLSVSKQTCTNIWTQREREREWFMTMFKPEISENSSCIYFKGLLWTICLYSSMVGLQSVESLNVWLRT